MTSCLRQLVRDYPMIDICYYSSDFYAPYTGISMYSLLKNNSGLDFRLNCIDSGISEENKVKMRELAGKFGKEIVFHDYTALESYIRDELKLPICSGSYATYIKVFPDKFFGDSEMVLFIDGDTIIDGSLEELFSLDMSGHVFAAAKVSLINESWVYDEDRSDNLRLQYQKRFKDFGYFNIGIFLVNIKKWGEVDFGTQIMQATEEHLPVISQVNDIPIDEMLINLAALKRRDEGYVLPLHPKFNCTTHNIPYKRGMKAALRCGYLDKDEYTEAYFHPVIVHFCIFKPWYTDAYSPYKQLVSKYRAESPWPDAFTETMQKTLPKKIFMKFFYSMQSERLMLLSMKCWRALSRVFRKAPPDDKQ